MYVNSAIAVGCIGSILYGLVPQTGQAQPQVASQSEYGAVEVQLYGQVPTANQIRKSYLIFQEIENKVVGAYYQPRSEFSCFTGSLDDQDLYLQIYGKENRSASNHTVSLDGLYSLSAPSQNDRRMLRVCRRSLI